MTPNHIEWPEPANQLPKTAFPRHDWDSEKPIRFRWYNSIHVVCVRVHQYGSGRGKALGLIRFAILIRTIWWAPYNKWCFNECTSRVWYQYLIHKKIFNESYSFILISEKQIKQFPSKFENSFDEKGVKIHKLVSGDECHVEWRSYHLSVEI